MFSSRIAGAVFSACVLLSPYFGSPCFVLAEGTEETGGSVPPQASSQDPVSAADESPPLPSGHTSTVPTASPETSSPSPAGHAFSLGGVSGLSGMILFGATVNGRESIFVLDLDGREVRPVIEGPGNNSYPSWSPDGRRFAFSSDRDGSREIYVSDWDGANQTRLTNNNVNDDNPSWSPTDNRVVYYSETGTPISGNSGSTDAANVFIVNLDDPARRPVQITRFSGRNTTPRFSSDGRSVSYSTNRFWPGWDVCAWDLNLRKEACLLTGMKTYCRQSYSPDGKRMAYSTGIHTDVDVGIVSLVDGTTHEVTSLSGREYDVIWSPDGKFLAFTAEDGRKEVYNLYVAQVSGVGDSPNNPRKSSPGEETPRQIILSPHSIRFLSWSPVKTIELEAERMRALQGE